MTIIESSLTRRTKTCAFGASAVDVAADPHGLVSASAAASFGIPERFKILSQIGTGGMGIVYKVRDLETGEILALKLLKPEVASNPKMREELRREVCLARRVTHKHVCRIHEFYRSDVSSCISMEFIDGETLLTKLRNSGALSIAESIRIARQICAGLREAHTRGIVHRDLKPANIMIDTSGVVKIMDFGIARLSQEDDPLTRSIAGTPEYMAPEQIELKAMAPRTDIYALGLLLYEMVTGAQVFTGETTIAVALKQLRESPRRPSEIVSMLPSGLEAVILKCLRKNPVSRFQSVDDLDSALDKPAATGTPSNAFGPPTMNMDAIVKIVSDKWRILRPQIVHFGSELNRTSNILWKLAQSESEKLARIAADAAARNRKKNHFVRFPAVAGVAVLGILLVAWMAGQQSERETSSLDNIVPKTFQDAEAIDSPPVPVMVASDASATPDVPVEPANLQNADLSVSAGPISDDSAIDISPAPATTADNNPLSNAPKPAPLKKRTMARKTAAPLPVKPSVSAAPIHTLPANQKAIGAYEPAAAVVSTDPQPAVSDPAAPNSGKLDSENTVPATTTYLEVGSFKDAKWADDAVERLSQLGFHTICVHKTILWKLQSYHVEVGPYARWTDVDDAEKRLSDQGFKSHIVK
jgi:serine/threonine protein kinase